MNPYFMHVLCQSDNTDTTAFRFCSSTFRNPKSLSKFMYYGCTV